MPQLLFKLTDDIINNIQFDEVTALKKIKGTDNFKNDNTNNDQHEHNKRNKNKNIQNKKGNFINIIKLDKYISNFFINIIINSIHYF